MARRACPLASDPRAALQRRLARGAEPLPAADRQALHPTERAEPELRAGERRLAHAAAVLLPPRDWDPQELFLGPTKYLVL